MRGVLSEADNYRHPLSVSFIFHPYFNISAMNMFRPD